MSFKKLFCILLALLFATSLWAELRADEYVVPQNRPHQLAGKRVFMPLPAGAVKPDGWLRDWSLAARDGYTAVMEEVDVEFVRAWTHDFSPTCKVGDWPNGSWSYEGGGYWFDGLVRLAYQLDDPELIALAKRRLGHVLDHTTPEGIGHFYWLRNDDSRAIASTLVGDGWGLWADGLYGRAMMEYYLASSDPRALQAMKNADNSVNYGSLSIVGAGSPPTNALNACEDYTCSGDEGVAKTLDYFYKDAPNKFYLWEVYKENPPEALVRGERFYRVMNVMRYHGVFFNEAITGWAAGTLWTGDQKYLDSARAWAKLMDDRVLQPHGAMVQDELYGPTGAYRGTETCTLAAEQFRRVFLFTMTGNGSEADKIERLFFNAGAGMVTRDFQQHAYHQQPNRITKDSFVYTWADPYRTIFQRKHYPLCCTAALNRIVPIFTQHLWMVTQDNGLAAVMYAPNTVTATVADGTKVTIETCTEYPFRENIAMTVKPEKTVTFPISLRMPVWCEQPQVTINGATVEAKADENGFLRIERAWQENDQICMTFPMSPKVELGIDRNASKLEPIPGATRGKGTTLGMYTDAELATTPYANIAYGPLLFVYPIPEVDENTPVENAKWQYALDPKHALEEVEVVRQEMIRPWRWAVDAPIQLKVKAVEGTWKHDFQWPILPKAEEIQKGENQIITLVPYGCAKLRISMFPVVEE